MDGAHVTMGLTPYSVMFDNMPISFFCAWSISPKGDDYRFELVVGKGFAVNTNTTPKHIYVITLE